MDPSAFDSLVRAYAATGTRRRLVALAAALPVVGALTGLASDDAGAEKPRDRIKRRKDANRRKRRNRKHNRNNRNNNGGGGSGNGGNRPNACTANGKPCQRNSDCCGDNCFGQVCTNAPNQCGGTNCPNNATGCCSGVCCQSPANQCNPFGQCCAPNCEGKECGADGCGNSGTCGACASGATCDDATGQCSCTPDCAGKQCGPDGCGGSCGLCANENPCSPTGQCPACGPANCLGCCDANGDCQTGANNTACDQVTGGNACCPGCCDFNGVCHPSDDTTCGVDGGGCVNCLTDGPPNLICVNGDCVCTPQSCPDGCCNPEPGAPGSICETSDSGFCGTGGVACAQPNGLSCTVNSDCCSGNCLNGLCADPCTPTSCPSGSTCCADGVTIGKCARANGHACTQDSDCCSVNCFDSVCADLTPQCGNVTCTPPAKGCSGIRFTGPICCEAPANTSCLGQCCAPPATKCCGDDQNLGTCCTAEQSCCQGSTDEGGNSVICCNPGTQCCFGLECCKAGQTCCPTTDGVALCCDDEACSCAQ